MKKLLTILGAITLISSSATSVIACGGNPEEIPILPEVEKLNWTEEDINEYTGKFYYVDRFEHDKYYILNSYYNKFEFNFGAEFNNLNVYFKNTDTFILNNILPESNSENPYDYGLVSSFTLDYDYWNENNDYATKFKYWDQINNTEVENAELRNKKRLNIYLETSDFYRDSIKVVDINNKERTEKFYYKILKTNYFVGAIYSNFDNLLSQFENEYSKDDHKFTIKSIDNTSETDLSNSDYNIEVQNIDDFSWNESHFVEGKTDAEVFSEYVENYILKILDDYSILKLNGEKIDLTIGELVNPGEDVSKEYYQQGLKIGDYVDYQGAVYRLKIKDSE